jgi:hypothetical protein
MLSAQSVVSAALTGRAERRAAYGNDSVQQAVRQGIGWLIAHQDEDGRFRCAQFFEHDPPGKECDGVGNPAYDVGATGLALLAMLAGADAGYHESAKTAADWLLSQLRKKTGMFAAASPEFVYEHAIATLAMVEAHAILGGGDYGDAASHGLRYLESHRNPKAAWRYQPRDGEGDASVTTWCIAAYCAATHAGIECSPETVAEALAWLETVSNPFDGHAGYQARDTLSARRLGGHNTKFPALLGTALVGPANHARNAAMWPQRDPLVKLGVEVLRKKSISNDPKARDFYTWFHAAGAIAGSDRATSQAWHKAAQQALLKLQRKDGAYAGSFDPNDVWGDSGGRVVSTAFAVLVLATPWRQGSDPLAEVLPDVVPFRGAHAKWRDGQLGAAVAALDEVLAGETTDEQRRIAGRAKWFAAVHRHAVQRFVTDSDKLYDQLGQRLLRAEQLVTTFGEDPSFADLVKVRNDLKAIPGAQDCVDAERQLAALLATFDRADPPTESSKRRALVLKFRKLLERYGRTPSAPLIQKWVTYFDR